MKLSWNWAAQIVAIGIHAGNLLLGVVPAEYRPTVTLLVGALQSASALVAHHYNPDGTSARAPWSGAKN